MAAAAGTAARPAPGARAQLAAGIVALAAGAAIGLATALGIHVPYLVAGVVSPFILLLIYARPHWGATIYMVLVYGDLLSTLTNNYGIPPLARFAGAVLLSAVLGYRLLIRRQLPTRDAMTWWLLAYGFSLATGIFVAVDKTVVQSDIILFVRDFLTYLVVINIITTPERLRRVLWALLSLAVFLALLTLYQSATGQFDNDFGGLAIYHVSEIASGNDAPRPGGTLGDANFYGQFLLIALPYALYLAFEERAIRARLLGGFAAVTLVAAIIFTYSRGDAVALAVLVLAVVVYKRIRPIYLAGAALGLLALTPLLPAGYIDRLTAAAGAVSSQSALYNEYSIRGRAGAVEAAIGMFADHLWLGVGRENYPLHELEYLRGSNLAFKSTGIPPHDLYLEIAAEQGLVGLTVFAGVLLTMGLAVREAHRLFLRAGETAEARLVAWLAIGMIGYLASCLFLHGAYIFLFWMQVALIIAMRQIARSALPGLRRPERS